MTSHYLSYPNWRLWWLWGVSFNRRLTLIDLDEPVSHLRLTSITTPVRIRAAVLNSHTLPLPDTRILTVHLDRHGIPTGFGLTDDRAAQVSFTLPGYPNSYDLVTDSYLAVLSPSPSPSPSPSEATPAWAINLLTREWFHYAQTHNWLPR
jgi:hypothetical protein